MGPPLLRETFPVPGFVPTAAERVILLRNVPSSAARSGRPHPVPHWVLDLVLGLVPRKTPHQKLLPIQAMALRGIPIAKKGTPPTVPDGMILPVPLLNETADQKTNPPGDYHPVPRFSPHRAFCTECIFYTP